MKHKLNIITKSLILGLSLAALNANAEWAVHDRTNAQHLSNLRSDLSKMLAGLNKTIETGNTLTDLQIKQDAKNLELTDARVRRAINDKQIVDEDMDLMPTLQKCVEVSRVQNTQGSFGGGGGGYSGGQSRIPAAPGNSGAVMATAGKVAQTQENVRTESSAVKEIVAGKQALGTCVGTMSTFGCSGDGTHPGADMNAISLFANVDKTKVSGPVTTISSNGKTTVVLKPANYSIDDKGVSIIGKLITNTVGLLPLKLSEAEAQSNPQYEASYQVVKTRVSYIEQGLSSIYGWRTASPLVASAAADWNNVLAPKYKEYFGTNAPANPSEFDYLRTKILQQREQAFIIAKEDDVAGLAANAITLNNLLMLKSIEKQDNIIALLASINATNINPVDIDRMKAQKNQFGSDKSLK